MGTVVSDPVLTFIEAGADAKAFRRILDPQIRKYERLYRMTVAANTPDMAVLDTLTTLQRWRQQIVGKKLRGYGKQYRIPLP